MLIAFTIVLSFTSCNAKTNDTKTELSDDSSINGRQEVSQLKAVFDNYFLLKDALVKTDSKNASVIAKDLASSLNAVKMETLKTEEHLVWMKVMKDLKEDVKNISETEDIKRQRDSFARLSKNMYSLIKVSKVTEPVYYINCPMFNGDKGANWLSKENEIKNPYYGSQMLSCGKTIEKIQ
ncbi:hypothetical protein D3C86_611440 [compost metagenome]